MATLVQSCILVYRIFDFEMYSFVIKIAIDVNKAVKIDITKPALGFNIAKLLQFIVEGNAIEISVIINDIFFFFQKFIYFFPKFSLSILRDIKLIS